METTAVFAILALYLYGAGRLIRWGAAKSEQSVPGWWDAIGTVLIPPLVIRATKWAVPDAWGWPEQVLGAGLGALVFYLLLRCMYRFKTRYTVLTIVLVYGLAVLMVLKMLPFLSNKTKTKAPTQTSVLAPDRLQGSQ